MGNELANFIEMQHAYFPSKTDTFGIVLIEALACGTPMAGLMYKSKDIVIEGVNGSLDEENLSLAVQRALKVKENQHLNPQKLILGIGSQ